ncbi:MAG: fatty acid desaturase [Gammaproteobacteria bacterium]|jgi:fatty acid desaturase
MAETFSATNAASSGVTLDRKTTKSLCKRSDRPGLYFLIKWSLSLFITGTLVHLSRDTFWLWPSIFVYGSVLSLPAYSMSHESAHGTAFRTRWLNELMFWITSLIYMEEPLHRRYTHTNHHTYTWHVGKDSQMPFDTPVTLRVWLLEMTGWALLHFHIVTLIRLVRGQYTDVMKWVIPADELPRIRRNACIFLGIYIAIGMAIVAGANWLLWYLVIPVFLGRITVAAFGLIQHVEMAENVPSIIDSTRSFRTNRLASFLYLNMENHIEHHLYPQVPFYSLPGLHEAIKSQLPEPDPGFWRTNLEALSVAIRRTLGKNTRASSIRQAPHMITEGGFDKVATRSMK